MFHKTNWLKSQKKSKPSINSKVNDRFKKVVTSHKNDVTTFFYSTTITESLTLVSNKRRAYIVILPLFIAFMDARPLYA
jgi:hypothetical protein